MLFQSERKIVLWTIKAGNSCFKRCMQVSLLWYLQPLRSYAYMHNECPQLVCSNIHMYLTTELSSLRISNLQSTLEDCPWPLITPVASSCAHSLTCNAFPQFHALGHYFLCSETLYASMSIWLITHPSKLILIAPSFWKLPPMPSSRINRSIFQDSPVLFRNIHWITFPL